MILGYVVVAACLVAIGYQLTAILAALGHLWRKDPPAPAEFPPISILKPVRGRDPGFLDALRSHARQDYPGGFEILIGVADAMDPAIGDIEQLRREYPVLKVRLIQSSTQALNGKVGVLMDLGRQARHPVWLVNDSDILVPPGYLRSVVAPLANPQVGVVTCLYRATARKFAGLFEALGINSDFMPSTLVAPFVGVREFGLGSTLVFRRAELDRIGGFAALADYIADDYQLAKRITQLGPRVHLSKTVVQTTLDGSSWLSVWLHQLRWHRTIRVSRGAYAGLPVTHASLWALLAWLAGFPTLAAVTLAVRVAMGVLVSGAVLRSAASVLMAPLIPVRDLWGSVVWAAGLFGSKVRWRDRTLHLLPDGRLQGNKV